MTGWEMVSIFGKITIIERCCLLRNKRKEEKSFDLTEQKLPINRSVDNSTDLLLRPLDCAVIEAYASLADPKFDSVRGVFWEGEDLYPGAGMKEKNHIQISIRNINCIKCFFIPRELK